MRGLEVEEWHPSQPGSEILVARLSDELGATWIVHGRVGESEARDFLARRCGVVEDLQPLGGGAWTSAYSFVLAGRPLVVRFGTRRDWLEAERAAMAFASPEIPVPEVLEVGDALGGAYAISARHYGINLEDVRPDQSNLAGPMLASLLGALFAVPKRPDLPVGWPLKPPRNHLTWRAWLHERIVDDPRQRVHGWRMAISSHDELDRLFRACEARFLDLVGATWSTGTCSTPTS